MVFPLNVVSTGLKKSRPAGSPPRGSGWDALRRRCLDCARHDVWRPGGRGEWMPATRTVWHAHQWQL